jgi:hypothetical protein
MGQKFRLDLVWAPSTGEKGLQLITQVQTDDTIDIIKCAMHTIPVGWS